MKCKCTVSFVSVVILIVVVGILALIILAVIPESCPNTSFRCDEDNKCLDMRFRCDGIPHCSSVNASDEIPYRCSDLTGFKEAMKNHINFTTSDSSAATTTIKPPPTPQPCLVRRPEECDCRNGFHIRCTNTNWKNIDWDKFHPNTTRLYGFGLSFLHMHNSNVYEICPLKLSRIYM